jgi:hypothetical protein
MAEGTPRQTRALAGVDEAIGRRIQILRGEGVLLDAYLPEFSRVKTKCLKWGGPRHTPRLPYDFSSGSQPEGPAT